MAANDVAFRIQHGINNNIIHRAITQPRGMTVLPPPGTSMEQLNPQQREALVINVVRSQDPVQAYMRIPGRQDIILDHHAPGWGRVYFGVILPRVQAGVFQCPSLQQAPRVAIKRLNKVVVHAALTRGQRENPYTEIDRMDELGDNQHVLGMIEALQDDQYLYIIMPFCHERSLLEHIRWDRGGFQEDQARMLFRNILENMIYLHRRGYCHRDLSPDNCMILNGRVVFADMAMSFRIPPHNPVVTGYGGFGTAAYVPPELRMDFPFDAMACDLWGAAVILFNMLVGEVAWREPLPGDINFRYLVLARGLARNPANERTVEILMNEPNEGSAIRRIAQRCIDLSPEVLDLLSGILQVSYGDRWNTEQVVNSDWVQNNEQWIPQG